MDDFFDLHRFVKTQEATATALAELVAGRKRSHWMMFVFKENAMERAFGDDYRAYCPAYGGSVDWRARSHALKRTTRHVVR